MTTKRIGRPPIGPKVAVRLPDATVTEIEHIRALYAERFLADLSEAEAVRVLVILALERVGVRELLDEIEARRK